MKKRTKEQAKKHKEYMRNYFKNNPEKKKKNNERNKKRGLEKIKCIHCEKMITRVNMKRHENVKHSFEKELQNGGLKGGKAPISQEGGE